MASFKRTFDTPVKLSTGMVGVGNKIYAEVWQVGPHKHELRVLIRKPSNVLYRDISWLTGVREWSIKNSFARTPIDISGIYHVDMCLIEHAVDTLFIHDTPMLKKWSMQRSTYTNNKGRYPSVWKYVLISGSLEQTGILGDYSPNNILL